MEHFKRASLSGLTDSLSGLAGRGKSHAHHPQAPEDTLEVVVESPPNIFYGVPERSTGALFSGQLQLTVASQPEIVLETFTMKLVCVTIMKKPVVNNCPGCKKTRADLHDWVFVKEPKHLPANKHSFPFSYLIPGHLPATCAGHLADLSYHLCAQATTRHGTTISIDYPLPIYRALHFSGEKNSLRVFPPTNVTIHATFSPLMYPIGNFNVLMRMNGLVRTEGAKQIRWRVREIRWQIEETEKMVSPACSKHAHKVGGEGKGLTREDVRILGRGGHVKGWKTDWSDGTTEMELTCEPNWTKERPLCDVAAPTGFSVSHGLVIETIIAEESNPLNKPGNVTHATTAKMLKAEFALIVTEREGMGISWDEEQPPMYEDVPKSPPLYSRIGVTTDYTGPSLDEPFDRLNLNDDDAGEGSSRR